MGFGVLATDTQMPGLPVCGSTGKPGPEWSFGTRPGVAPETRRLRLERRVPVPEQHSGTRLRPLVLWPPRACRRWRCKHRKRLQRRADTANGGRVRPWLEREAEASAVATISGRRHESRCRSAPACACCWCSIGRAPLTWGTTAGFTRRSGSRRQQERRLLGLVHCGRVAASGWDAGAWRRKRVPLLAQLHLLSTQLRAWVADQVRADGGG